MAFTIRISSSSNCYRSTTLNTNFSDEPLFGHLFQGRFKAVVLDGSDDAYFQVASTYIHLNPARAKLIVIGRDKLKRYRWSSYPWFLSGRAPDWLCRDQVMGSVGLRRGQGRGYEAYIEARVLELAIKARRQELEEDWNGLRRGWYLGGETFREQLIGLLEKASKGRQRASHSGPARVAHDQATGERLLRAGVTGIGLQIAELRKRSKGAPEKAALAWWLRQRTTVRLAWIAEQLEMGHASRVSQAVARMRNRPSRRLKQLRRILNQVET
jgi:hypothetical protein